MMKDLDYKYILVCAKDNSVNYSTEIENKRKKPIVKKSVEMEEEKFNTIKSSVNQMINSSLELLVINEVNKKFEDFINPSYEKGFDIITEIEEKSEGPLNYEEVANAYNSQTDFNSYVFGIFSKVYLIDRKMALIKMNNIFYWLSMYGYSSYATFEDYCFSKGYYIEEKGNKKIDIPAYKRGIALYLKELKDKEGK